MTRNEQQRYAIDAGRFQRRMERRAYRICKAMLSGCLERVGQLLPEVFTPDGSQIDGGRDSEGLIRRSIDESRVRQLLTDIYNAVGPYYAEREFDLVRDRTRFAMKREGSLFNIGFFSRKWMELMRTLMADSETAKRVQNITEQTRKLIRQALERAQTERLDTRGTARVIREILGGKAMRNRALLIARTETTRAANLGAEMGASQTGIVLQKVWIATADSRTRPAHRAMLGKKPIGKDELFNVGGVMMKYPGDPAGGVDNCANCRCVVSYVPLMRNGMPVLVGQPDLPQRLATMEILQEASA